MSTSNQIPRALNLVAGLGLIALMASGCGRLADGEDREPFGTLGDDGGDADGDGDGDGDGGGGEVSETCWDGIPQPGELCTVQAPDLDAGIDPCSLAIADIDDDGRQDIAVPNSNWLLPPGSAHVTNILRGYGNGNFAPTEAHDAGAELPVGLALGDFDGDGDLDIATANNEADAAFLVLNQGGMSFTDAVGEPVDATASSIEAGDVDNDGVDDLLVTTPAGLALITNGPGGAQFSAMIDVGGGNPMHAELVDMNGDGNLDIIAAVMDQTGGDDRIMIFRGEGDGTFPDVVSHPVAGDPWWVVAGDLNMDGDLDLAAAVYGDANISILLGNDQGGFSPRTEVLVCDGPQSVAIGDMNNDGANDLVVGCMDTDRVEVWLQEVDGVFDRVMWWSTGSRPVSVKLADFNLDGALDVAWANQYSDSVGMALSHP